MSLQIFIAHTGERIDCAAPLPTSLDALKSWIAKATTIPPQDQVLLTTKGKPFKQQNLFSEVCFFQLHTHKQVLTLLA
jgi:autophagy-related protein 11